MEVSKKSSSNITNAGIITEDGNSELFNTGEWRNKKPVHSVEKCKNCMLCVAACPDNAILHNDDDKMCGFDYTKCKGCGVCAKVCPFKAISMTENDAGGDN